MKTYCKQANRQANYSRAIYRFIAAAAAKSFQSCPTLCNPTEGSPPRSPIPGILQARTLEWVAISFSNAWKWKGKVKSLSRVWLLATPWTAAYQLLHPWDFPGKSTGVGCHCLLRQIQCNPYQIANGIFHRIRTKKFTFCMETQNTMNSQCNHEKKKKNEARRNHGPCLQTILQSYSNWNSRLLAPNPEMKINGTGQKAQW